MLTIATPFGGREGPFLDRWLNGLTGLHVARSSTHLLWLDNSGDRGFSERLAQEEEKLRQAFASVRVVNHPAQYVEDATAPDQKTKQVAALWQKIRDEVETEYVLCLESDVVPAPDVVDRLLSLLCANASIGAASAIVPWWGPTEVVQPMIWEIVEQRLFPEGDACSDLIRSVRWVEEIKAEGGEPIDAVSLSCVVARADVFKSATFEESMPNISYDHQFCVEAWDKGNEVWVDWLARCHHLKVRQDEVVVLEVPGLPVVTSTVKTNRVYPSVLGPIHLVTDCAELEAMFDIRLRWQGDLPRVPPIRVAVGHGTEVDVAELLARAEEPRTFEVHDAAFSITENGIEGIIPHRSYYTGIILEWLWLAIPTFFPPDGWEAVHAAAVENGDGATLIVGESGSGKSTTLVEFLKNGCGLLSDDLVLVNPEQGRVRGWDMTMHLTVEKALELGAVPTTTDFAGKVRVSGTMFKQATTWEYPIQLVVVLEAEETRHRGWGFEAGWVPDCGAKDYLFGRADLWGAKPSALSLLVSNAIKAPSYPKALVCTPFAGKPEMLRLWLRHFKRSGIPANADLLWVCNSDDPSFQERLQQEAEALGARLVIDTRGKGTKDDIVASLWRKVAGHVDEEYEYVVTVEDDVLLPSGGVSQLLDVARVDGIVGVPVPHRQWDGTITKMAWTIVEDDEGYRFIDAPHDYSVAPVDAVSLSYTVFPAELFRRLSFVPASASPRTKRMGYDLLACKEAAEAGWGVYAAWQLEAGHMKPDVIYARDYLRVAVLGPGSHAVPNGPNWRVVAHEAEGLLSALIRKHASADLVLYVEGGIRVTQEYVASAIQALSANRRAGMARGASVTEAGKVLPFGAAFLRPEAATMVAAATLSELRQRLHEEHWEEAKIGEAVCLGLPTVRDQKPLDPPPPRVAHPSILFQNRHPWVGPQPGFGGDLSHVFGNMKVLRELGYRADFRTVDLKYYYEEPWDIIHLFHTQFEWVRDFEFRDLEGRGLIVTAVTHGKPAKQSWQPVVSRADKLLVYSDAEAEFYLDSMPELEGKIGRYPVGIPAEIYEVGHLVDPDDPPSVFMAARYCDYKNQLMALRACRALDVPVFFAGPDDSPEYAEYKRRLVREAGPWEKAHFLGLEREKDLWRLYQRSHVHVLPSKFEPWGIVSAEALAFGCNIVHTKNSWAADEFGKHGTLCDPEDQHSVIEAIESELAKPRGWAGAKPMTEYEATKLLVPIYEEVSKRVCAARA